MLKIVVVGSIHEEGMQLLRARSDFAVDVLSDLSPAGIAKGVAGAHGISIRTQKLTKEILALAPDLRIVSRHGVGFDNVDVAYLSSRKIPMALAVDSNFTAVAEHTLMMMLCLVKDAFACDEAVRAGDFDYRQKGTMSDLMKKHVLIMGLGRIGRRVADLCLAFDMRVSAYDPYVQQSPAPGIEMVADFRSALSSLDFLSLHMPATTDSVGMIGAKELAMLQPHVFIVNCARGGIIDETLLAQALSSGAIRGVGMDVFAQEPHDHTHPLFQQKRCLFTPHNAALSVECSIRMAKQAAQNIIDCMEGVLQARVVANRQELGLE